MVPVIYGIFLTLSWYLSYGADWPNYGGISRSHSSEEQTLRLDWGYDEPKVLWKLEVGLGDRKSVV